MRMPKFLQFQVFISAFAAFTIFATLFAVSGLSACSGARPAEFGAAAGSGTLAGSEAARAAAAAAEKFAVSLANDRCEGEYGQRPFRTGRFPAIRSGDRWLWGWLDGRESGFTAQVSFRVDHTTPEARIYPATDETFDMEAPNAPDLDLRPDPGMITRQPEAE